MADTKISALTAATVVADANEFPINEAGTTKKVTALQIMQQTNYHHVHMDWLGVGGPTPNSAVVGTGTATLGIHHGLTLTTGATNPSSSSIYQHMEPGVTASAGGLISKVRRLEIYATVADTFVNSNTFLYLTEEAVITIPTGTPRHFGIKNLTGVVSFTTADGTTEQLTDISAFVTANKAHIFVVTFDGTTAILYIDGTQRASHATNVPAAGGACAFRAFINNNASANSRTFQPLGFDVIWLNG